LNKSHPLAPLIAPKSIAILGASPKPLSFGRTTVENLRAGNYPGRLYPIHPDVDDIAGYRCYRDLASVPDQLDCVIVALAADKVPLALEQSAQKGAKGAILFAAGFGESGEAGFARKGLLRSAADQYGLQICGPNCLGLINVADNTHSFSAPLSDIRKGGVALISQSGSGCCVVSTLNRFGFSLLVSSGNEEICDTASYLDYLVDDSATTVVGCIIESIRDPRRLARSLRRLFVAGKPVVCLCLGRSFKGAEATASHTGALASDFAVVESFLRAQGAILVGDLDELSETLAIFEKRPVLPGGGGLAVVNISGGEIGLTCDIAQELNIELPELSAKTTSALRAVMPHYGTAKNPLDATATALYDSALYKNCVRILASDASIDLVLAAQDCAPTISDDQATLYSNVSRAVAEVAPDLGISFDGGNGVAKPVIFASNISLGLHPTVTAPLAGSRVPALQGTRNTLLAIRSLIDHARLRREGLPDAGEVPRAQTPILAASKDALTERGTKAILRQYGVPVCEDALALTADAAVEIGGRIRGPVVLKIESRDIVHKSDVGGVTIGVRGEAEIRAAYATMMDRVRAATPHARIDGILVQPMIPDGVDVFVGVKQHERFGLAIVVGLGGVDVELWHDTALALLPLDPASIRKLIAKTRVAAMVAGRRGRGPFDEPALVEAIEAIGRFALAEREHLQELDVNPLRVLPIGQGAIVLDATVVTRHQAESS
jgi:acetate---CoA ligase (ADP-forming)